MASMRVLAEKIFKILNVEFDETSGFNVQEMKEVEQALLETRNEAMEDAIDAASYAYGEGGNVSQITGAIQKLIPGETNEK